MTPIGIHIDPIEHAARYYDKLGQQAEREADEAQCLRETFISAVQSGRDEQLSNTSIFHDNSCPVSQWLADDIKPELLFRMVSVLHQLPVNIPLARDVQEFVSKVAGDYAERRLEVVGVDL